MRRRIRVVLLTLGMIGGFGAGIASLVHGGCHRHAAFEQHVAQLCADAVRRTPAPPPATP